MAVSMKVLSNHDEWLLARKNRIGGSDASAIVGMNPYKTNIELWEEKTGRRVAPDISDESYVKYGHDAEEYLRELFAIDYPQYQVLYEDNNMWTNDKYPFAHASLDSWLVDEDGRKGVLEIKTTNILQSMQKEKWKDRIPDNYYLQVLHYLMVTEFEFAILKAQLKYEHNNGDVFLTTKHYMMERAEVEEDINYLEDAERRFYEYIINDRQPNLVLPAI